MILLNEENESKSTLPSCKHVSGECWRVVESGGVMVQEHAGRSWLAGWCHHQGGLLSIQHHGQGWRRGGDLLQGPDRGHRDAGSVEGGLPGQQQRPVLLW